MKLTKQQLKQIIKEELEALLGEDETWDALEDPAIEMTTDPRYKRLIQLEKWVADMEGSMLGIGHGSDPEADVRLSKMERKIAELKTELGIEQ